MGNRFDIFDDNDGYNDGYNCVEYLGVVCNKVFFFVGYVNELLCGLIDLYYIVIIEWIINIGGCKKYG